MQYYIGIYLAMNWFNQASTAHDWKKQSFPSSQFNFDSICDNLKVYAFRLSLKNRAT